MMRKRMAYLALGMGLLFTTHLRAQFYLGIEAGGNKNYLITSNQAQSFTVYDPKGGFSLGVPVLYQFNEWFALQSGLSYTQKNYQINRTGSFQGIYQKNTNSYMELPVLAHFSFGDEQLKGFINLGGYAAYWMSDHLKGVESNVLNTVDSSSTSNTLSDNTGDYGYSYSEPYQFSTVKDKRLELGWIAGVGISYETTSGHRFFIEGRYTASVTDQQKNYEINQVPRYNTTWGISIGCFFRLTANDNIYHYVNY